MSVGAGDRLPIIRTPLSAQAVLERMTTASRRGRMPGYEALGGADAAGGEGDLFLVAAHGKPFDADLIVRYERAGAAGGGGLLNFRLKMHWRLRAIFIALLLLTIWPGAYFMDELVAIYLRGLWRPWVTYWWYLPITILPLPWIWRGVMKRARASTQNSAREAIAKVAAEVSGEVLVGEIVSGEVRPA